MNREPQSNTELPPNGESSLHDLNLKGRSVHELEALFKEIGEPAFRGRQAFRRINKHLTTDINEFSDFPAGLRHRLEGSLPDMPVVHSSVDPEGTEKCIFDAGSDRRGNEKKIEAVWIVSPRRRTICISSQIGCTLNCTFCATGTLKFQGNLETWQIVEQVYSFMRRRGEKATNIVFMGMGEPFYNYENVIRAARILHHPDGLNMSARHITISTAGVITGIEKFTVSREPFNLAVSLNHPDLSERTTIMDVNKKFPLDKLLIAVRKYTREMDRKITFEYVMIPDVNMGSDNARKLIKIGRSVRCKINLIPLNTGLKGFRRPTPDEVLEFQNILLDADLDVFNRGSPGLNINAACGMLALSQKAPA